MRQGRIVEVEILPAGVLRLGGARPSGGTALLPVSRDVSGSASV